MKDRPSIMSRLAARRPSPAMAVALMALFASTGGVSYALATGSIGSREIKNSSIQGKDVGKNEITAREIARRSIDGTDVKVNRVGGNAVKEEVLEAEKIGKVLAAVGADLLGGMTAQQIIAAARAGGSAGPAGPQGPAGPNSPVVPIAVFQVKFDGSLEGENHRLPVTGPPAPTKSSTGHYSVDLPGVDYGFTTYATVCTTVNADENPRAITTYSSAGDLKVGIEANEGTDTDATFNCSIYEF